MGHRLRDTASMIGLRSEYQTGGPAPAFQPGQLIKHRRYRYRGVVVGYDLEFRSSDEWYQANKTQPKRNQPWYHVLVHEAIHTTYAAQSSLMADPSSDPIDHPLLDMFFSDFINGQYIRNDTEWPYA